MKRIGLFLKKQGFFLMLALCLCVIGASALWARSQADAPAQEDVDAGADMAQSLREAQRMRLNTAPLEGEEGAPFGRTVWLETLECWGAHEAIDIAAQRGTPVLAAAPGRVTQARRDRLWGRRGGNRARERGCRPATAGWRPRCRSRKAWRSPPGRPSELSARRRPKAKPARTCTLKHGWTACR